jgi:hypothetical protein
MSTAQPRETLQRLTQTIVKLIGGNPTVVVDLIFDVLQHIPVVKSLPGMYEVLDYEAQVELLDSKGQKAVYTKRQHVRFLQDNIIAYRDTAWGDGDIFADYQCSPGVEVDRYREGHRYNILISLRETKQRDDEATLYIRRKIKNGFRGHVESFQTEIDHRTKQMELSVIFPKKRLPSEVALIEQNTSRTTILDSKQRHILSDGRHKYFWKTQSARLYEAYILRWKW